MTDLEKTLRKHPHSTAKQLAALMGCSVPTAYRRLRALRAGGAAVSEFKKYKGTTGPQPVQYALVKP